MTLINETGVEKYNTDTQGELIEHFLGGNYNASNSPVGNIGFINTVTGTGAGITVSSITNRLGVVSLNTGTVATGLTYLFTNSTIVLDLTNISISFESYFSIPTLSDATNTFTVTLGFSNVGITFTKYCVFVAIGNSLVGRVSAGSGFVSTPSFTISANTWYLVKTILTPTNARFFVNGALIGTLTTNLPVTSAHQLGVLATINKSVGTTSRNLLLDYIKVAWRL